MFCVVDEEPSVPQVYVKPPLDLSVGMHEEAAWAGAAAATAMVGTDQARLRATVRRDTPEV